MVYRPAQVYNGSGWDDIGDKRMLTHDHSGGADGTNIPQSSVTDLTSDLASKLAYPSGGSDGNLLTKSGTGAAWTAPVEEGLTFITAASFSAASTISFNNVFTSDYFSYRILGEYVTSANAQVSMRLRASGSDVTASNYNHQGLEATDTTVGGFRQTSQTAWYVVFTGSTNKRHEFNMRLIAPADAADTRYELMSFRATNSTGIGIQNLFGTYLAGTTVDGFTIYPASGTIQGVFWIYGYRRD